MSYQATHMAIYGIEVDFNQSKDILLYIAEKVWEKELKENFPTIREEWINEIVDSLPFHYDILKSEGKTDFNDSIIDIYTFFDLLNLCEHFTPLSDREIIPSYFDQHKNKQYYRYRYYTDLFSIDADTRSESLRFNEGKNSVFGVYLASNGYAYEDDVNSYTSTLDKRAIANFENYCWPVLRFLHIPHQNPDIHHIIQTW